VFVWDQVSRSVRHSYLLNHVLWVFHTGVPSLAARTWLTAHLGSLCMGSPDRPSCPVRLRFPCELTPDPHALFSSFFCQTFLCCFFPQHAGICNPCKSAAAFSAFTSQAQSCHLFPCPPRCSPSLVGKVSPWQFHPCPREGCMCLAPLRGHWGPFYQTFSFPRVRCTFVVFFPPDTAPPFFARVYGACRSGVVT